MPDKEEENTIPNEEKKEEKKEINIEPQEGSSTKVCFALLLFFCY
jgi:hypothetical protein